MTLYMEAVRLQSFLSERTDLVVYNLIAHASAYFSDLQRGFTHCVIPTYRNLFLQH